MATLLEKLREAESAGTLGTAAPSAEMAVETSVEEVVPTTQQTTPTTSGSRQTLLQKLRETQEGTGGPSADDLMERLKDPNLSAQERAKINQMIGIQEASKIRQEVTGKPGLLRSFVGEMAGVGKGILKGIGQTAAEASTLGEKMLSFGRRKDTAGEAFVESGVFEPKTAAEKVGKGAEQVAELIAPVPGMGKVRALKGGVGLVEKGAQILGKTAVEAVEAGAKTAIQTGGDPKEIEKALIYGGAGSVVGSTTGKVAQATKKFLKEKLSPRLINSIIKPSSKEFRFSRNPGESVAKEGLTGKTRESLLENITAKKKEIMDLRNKHLAAPDIAAKEIDVSRALTPIDEAMKKAREVGEKDLYARLSGLKEAMTMEFEEEGGKLVAKGAKNLKMNPLSASELKTKIGESTRWTGQAFDNDLNQVKVSVYRNINDMIDAAAPGTKDLNNRYANLLGAEKSLDNAINVAERHNLLGVGDIVTGTMAAGAQAAVSGLSPVTLAVGLLGAGGRKLLGSTAVKSNLASMFQKLSPEEMAGVEKAMPFLRSIILQSQRETSPETER